MKPEATSCPVCGDLMVPSEAALNRSLGNALLCGFGSSELQIRPRESGHWVTVMTPSRNAEALYCTACGALLLAPSVPRHREELGLD
jgi:ribosomal protein S27E